MKDVIEEERSHSFGKEEKGLREIKARGKSGNGGTMQTKKAEKLRQFM